MNASVRFPDDDAFLEDLVLQRTGDFVRLGGRPALETWFTTGDRKPLSRHLRQAGLARTFLEETQTRLALETDALCAWLGHGATRRVVSIGPGNGLVELFLFRQLRYESLLLIDIETSLTHNHGFARSGSGYASLAATTRFLVDNGVPLAALQRCNPSRQTLPTQRFDLLISLLAMGFHFPCDDYVDFLIENAAPSARLVLDKRRGVPDAGYERLGASARLTQRLPSAKFDRVLLEFPALGA